MLFFDGVRVECPDGSMRFRWVRAPCRAELARLTQAVAPRNGRYLECQGSLERDSKNSNLAGDELKGEAMAQQGRRCSRCRRCRHVTRFVLSGLRRGNGIARVHKRRAREKCVCEAVAGAISGPYCLPPRRWPSRRRPTDADARAGQARPTTANLPKGGICFLYAWLVVRLCWIDELCILEN